MHKIATKNMSFVSPPIRGWGFGVATFDFAPDTRGDEKIPDFAGDFPGDFPAHLMTKGKRT
jgi:hypothetical protein